MALKHAGLEKGQLGLAREERRIVDHGKMRKGKSLFNKPKNVYYRSCNNKLHVGKIKPFISDPGFAMRAIF